MTSKEELVEQIVTNLRAYIEELPVDALKILLDDQNEIFNEELKTGTVN